MLPIHIPFQQTLNVSGSLTVNKGRHRIILDDRANREEADNKLTAKNDIFNVRWDYFLSKRAFVSVINVSEYDEHGSTGTIFWIDGLIF